MTLALQALPLALLLVLLATGRAGPATACLAALAASLPALALTLDGPVLPFLLAETPRAAWLALQPLAIMTGGLLFHAAVEGEGDAEQRPASPARIFAVTLPLGAFLESVTGFAVGAVFALAALRRMGLRGPVAVALSLHALVLVPWGALGPGTALGAALVGISAHDSAALSAWPSAAWVVSLAPVLWSLQARAGQAPPWQEASVQALGLLAIGVGLVLWHCVLPFEVVGIAATGPVAAWALWRADPPRDLRTALGAAWPYLLLIACLLLARAVPGMPEMRPFPDLPGFSLTHVAVVLWAVSLALLLSRGRIGRSAAALARARRPALTLMLYVVFGRWLAGGGIAAALAGALAGAGAAYAVVPMGFLTGFVTGSNVSSNAALMPVQAALGAALGWPPLLAPALHNYAGASGAGLAIAGTAMLCALDGTARPGQVWRLALPMAGLALLWGTVAMLAWR
ncbi:L-lactate permease [Sabulicella glaciei]|uniref:L-lactate permease n=1 Tax=Sabulicella glaciei TaxID=2984948 RepID=A0ABT3NXK8_9PROT|nr:L-lactate permease [Roseococcus sp. MDT2-1-1]